MAIPEGLKQCLRNQPPACKKPHRRLGMASMACASVCILVACTTTDGAEVSLGAGSYADVATTSVALNLADGFVEANPVLSPCGPAAGICAAGTKIAVQYAYIESGLMTPDEAEVAVELPSAALAGANAGVMMGGGALAAVFGAPAMIGMAACLGVIPAHQGGHRHEC